MEEKINDEFKNLKNVKKKCEVKKVMFCVVFFGYLDYYFGYHTKFV